MRQPLFFLLLISICSCIPIKVAPHIDGDKIVKTKKFKKDLPPSYGYVFEDPKDADEFFEFMNMKFDLKYENVVSNVPIKINNTNFFLSFYERERVTKTINLLPIVVDAKLESEGKNTLMEDSHTSRAGTWYLILTVYDVNMNDCLSPEYKDKEQITSYLRSLKNEYLRTHNYIESYLRMEQ